MQRVSAIRKIRLDQDAAGAGGQPEVLGIDRVAGGEARPCLLRLFTAVLQDQHDEWQDGRRHFSQQSMARVMHSDGPPLLTNPLTEGLVA